MTNGHNSAGNGDIIQSVAKNMRDIKNARAALNERASVQRTRLKDAGIEPAAFFLVLRIADLDDEASRQHYMDSLADSWSTLGIGGELDWVTALDAEAAIDEVTTPEEA